VECGLEFLDEEGGFTTLQHWDDISRHQRHPGGIDDDRIVLVDFERPFPDPQVNEFCFFEGFHPALAAGDAFQKPAEIAVVFEDDEAYSSSGLGQTAEEMKEGDVAAEEDIWVHRRDEHVRRRTPVGAESSLDGLDFGLE